MNKLYCLIIILLTCRICEAQNLVPNPSFEDTVACPWSIGLVSYCVSWNSYRNNPDYFNPCNNGIAGVPNNLVGYQFAHSGNAYTGLIAYGVSGQNYREFIGVPLLSPTIIGQKYYATFYVSWTAVVLGYTLTVNKLGITLTTQPYSQSNYYPITNSPMAYSDSIYSDSIGWSKIQLSFIADSSYQYLILGNFFDDSQTDTVCYGQTSNTAYYYIDDICLSTDSLTCNSPVGVNKIQNESEISLFPNPFSDKINITAKRNDLVGVNLFDVTSRKIFNQSFSNSTSINTEQLAKGIYLYELRNKNGVIKKGKVVKD